MSTTLLSHGHARVCLKLFDLGYLGGGVRGVFSLACWRHSVVYSPVPTQRVSKYIDIDEFN